VKPELFFNLDIEPTNRCNAHCYFCPRDQTPHQGLMSPEVFDKSLARAVEFREITRELFGAEIKVNLCGLGEPLLNRHTPEFARKVRDAGFECSVSTNGALLDERRAQALLDAGVQALEVNIGEEGADYDEIYGLPFEKSSSNVVRFKEAAGDRCQVRIVLVDHRRDPAHIAKMAKFWRERGFRQFLQFPIMNRAGALFVDEMQYASFPEAERARQMLEERAVTPLCPAPFQLLFIGYDGQYYLCCSDWKKEVPLGSVFDESFLSITRQKLEHVSTRAPICASCNHDPLNRLTDELRTNGQSGADEDRPAVETVLDEIVEWDALTRRVLGALEARAHETGTTLRARRFIPVEVE